MFEPAWLSGDDPRKPDTHVGFRGGFTLLRSSAVEFRILGASWFTVWLDGELFSEGPPRFPPGHPEYEVIRRTLPAGKHVVAASVHHHGIQTRILRGDVPPFFWCQARDLRHQTSTPIELSWKATLLRAYKASAVRISQQFAWIDWCDTRELPHNWQAIEFDDSSWATPIAQDVKSLGEFRPARIGSLHHSIITPKLIAQGTLSGPFDAVDLPTWTNEGDVSWYKRNLHPRQAPSGVWRRYDLGRVRLGAPRFAIDLPEGSVVEFAYSESLTDKPIFDGYEQHIVAEFDGEPEGTRYPRVAPYIPLSYPTSRNLDHFIARGAQAFQPSSPRGGRFFEIHIQADPAKVKFLSERYIERAYFGEPVGSLDCDDAMLNRVWTLGIDTLRACTEDAVIDNPTRERGQWTGDVLLSMYISAAGYGDLRPFRRAIEQSAYCAREDGLVAGLNPGGPAYLSTYGAQWVTSAVNYFDLTGERDLLEAMFPYSERNFAAFENRFGPEGIDKSLAWCFIDWGYPPSTGASDTALNIHAHEAAQNMVRWCGLIEKPARRFRQLEDDLRAIIADALAPKIAAGDFAAIGYHTTVLALRAGFVPRERRASAINFVKRHILSCFPNNPDAPRLSDPKVASRQLITPYFSYYAFPVLIDAGEMNFVLEQYRECWGWAIEQGLTTQPEVFDLNWSHCHVWASSPTAQLTKYVLGLRARFGAGVNHFDLRLVPGSLTSARGRVPIPFCEECIEVQWNRANDGSIEYELRSPVEVWIDQPGEKSIKVGPGRTIMLRL